MFEGLLVACPQTCLLTDVHWGLAHALSPAEESLTDVQLPQLDRMGQELAASIQVNNQGSCPVSDAVERIQEVDPAIAVPLKS